MAGLADLTKAELIDKITEMEAEAEAQAAALGEANLKISQLEEAAPESVDVDAAVEKAVSKLRSEFNAVIAEKQEAIEQGLKIQQQQQELIVELERKIIELQAEGKSEQSKQAVVAEPEPEMRYCKGLFSYYPVEDFEGDSEYSKAYLESRNHTAVSETTVKRRPDQNRVIKVPGK